MHVPDARKGDDASNTRHTTNCSSQLHRVKSATQSVRDKHRGHLQPTLEHLGLNNRANFFDLGSFERRRQRCRDQRFEKCVRLKIRYIWYETTKPDSLSDYITSSLKPSVSRLSAPSSDRDLMRFSRSSSAAATLASRNTVDECGTGCDTRHDRKQGSEYSQPKQS